MNDRPRLVARFRDHPWFFTCALLVALKLWLVAAQPITAFGNAGHDDRLFLNLANHILCLDWLGPYNQLTLAKGPMYPLWISATVILGIPLPVAQHLLYLAGCVLVVRAVRPHLPSDRWMFVLFLLLWWNPMTYQSTVLNRVLRQNLYTPATLLYFAALFALETRRLASRRIRLAWGALLGLAGGAIWLTREESIWIVPSAVLLVAAAAWSSWRGGDRARSLVAPLLVGGGGAAAMLTTICALNAHYYGWWGTVEFRSPEFIQAYGALQRVKPKRALRMVPITREARERIYAVSPAFAELRPTLEGATGLAWAANSSSTTHLPKEKREIAGGWFIWALRDAVSDAGHAHSAREALDFYARIADEVNAACDDGRLPAYPRHDTLVPRWGSAEVRRFGQALPAALDYFITFRDFTAWTIEGDGSPHLLRLFNDITRWPLTASKDAPELERRRESDIDPWRIFPLQMIGTAYRWVGMIAGYGGLLAWGWLVGHAWRVRRLSYSLIATTAVAGGALAVVLINTLVDVLSFPNRSPGAFAEAYPLLLLFGGLTGIELWSSLQSGRRGPAPAGRARG